MDLTENGEKFLATKLRAEREKIAKEILALKAKAAKLSEQILAEEWPEKAEELKEQAKMKAKMGPKERQAARKAARGNVERIGVEPARVQMPARR